MQKKNFVQCWIPFDVSGSTRLTPDRAMIALPVKILRDKGRKNILHSTPGFHLLSCLCGKPEG